MWRVNEGCLKKLPNIISTTTLGWLFFDGIYSCIRNESCWIFVVSFIGQIYRNLSRKRGLTGGSPFIFLTNLLSFLFISFHKRNKYIPAPSIRGASWSPRDGFHWHPATKPCKAPKLEHLRILYPGNTCKGSNFLVEQRPPTYFPFGTVAVSGTVPNNYTYIYIHIYYIISIKKNHHPQKRGSFLFTNPFTSHSWTWMYSQICLSYPQVHVASL